MASGTRLQTVILLCAAIALISKNIWFNLVGYSPAFVLGDEAFASTGRFGFMAASAVFMIIFATLGQKAIGRHTPLFPLVPAIMLMGTGTFGLASSQSLVSAESMFLTGGILMGIGNAWGTLCVYSVLARTGTLWQVVVCMAVSSSVTAVATASIQELGSPGIQVSVAVASTITLFIGLLAAFRLLEKHSDEKAFPVQRTSGLVGEMRESASFALRDIASNRGLVFQLAMITIVMIALRGSSNGGVWGDQRITGSMFAGSLGLMVAVFLAVSLVSFRIYFKNPTKSRYHIPLLVLIGCFLLLALAGDSVDGTLRSTLNSAIELFCQLIFTFAIVDGMRKISSSGLVIAGLATGFSWVLALLWMLLLESIGLVANTVIVVIAYLLVVLVASPQSDTTPQDVRRKTADGTAEAPSPFDGVIEQSRLLAEEYRLTSREGEILELLAQGRSVPYICKELVLAEGTVRTHMTRIYRKLGIHSKQELLDLLLES